MNLQKLSPWNWFKSENADTPTPPSSVEPRRSELSPFMGMHQELDRWMDSVMRQFGMPSLESRAGDLPGLLQPRLDIAEHDSEYVISVEVPGVEEKDLAISLDDHRLVIEGEKRQESHSEDNKLHRIERSYGRFQRVLDLPGDAKDEDIKASFKNGILTVRVPRSEQAKAARREIPIQ
ncbi:heat-shock protein Hsp20 [Vreelandella olivaria]|uniref:Heat-shock protein Hsp20 n=1 Tax=Vreelandella olivaria TaxID=390919 RepID=A0ABM7GBH1_9GAMM|nr:heat-shock protein Hsp20 [Halomonas olivaria]